MPDSIIAPEPPTIEAPTPAESGGANPGGAQSVEQMEDEVFAALLAEEQGRTGEPESQPNDPAKPTAKEPQKDSSKVEGKTPVVGGTDGKTPSPSTETPLDEELTKDIPPEVRKANERVANAQMKMHEATRARAALEKRMAELEKVLKEKDDALAKIKPPEEAEIEKLSGSLDARTLRLLDETPELKGVFGALLNRLSALEQGLGDKVEERLAAKEKAAKEVAETGSKETWMRELLLHNPDFFEVVESPEFVSWREAHAETVNSTLKRFGNYDPKGALAVFRMFERSQSESGRGGPAHNTPIGLSGRGGIRTGSPGKTVQTREEMEQEVLEALLADEVPRR